MRVGRRKFIIMEATQRNFRSLRVVGEKRAEISHTGLIDRFEGAARSHAAHIDEIVAGSRVECVAHRAAEVSRKNNLLHIILSLPTDDHFAAAVC